MNHFDEIYEIAIENYGLVTYADALEAGITGGELNRFTANGRLERIGHGVYKLVRYVPTPYDQYAAAVTLVGRGAYVYGESVLAMHNLALVNPCKTIVATPKRVRKTLPSWIQVVPGKASDIVSHYEGIPCQRVDDAFRACRNTIMKNRLADGLGEAASAGLMSENDVIALRKELEV